jgi:hypothetical protein
MHGRQVILKELGPEFSNRTRWMQDSKTPSLANISDFHNLPALHTSLKEPGIASHLINWRVVNAGSSGLAVSNPNPLHIRIQSLVMFWQSVASTCRIGKLRDVTTLRGPY